MSAGLSELPAPQSLDKGRWPRLLSCTRQGLALRAAAADAAAVTGKGENLRPTSTTHKLFEVSFSIHIEQVDTCQAL